MPQVGERLNLPDPRREMMVCYSVAINRPFMTTKVCEEDTR